jgi:6-phosphogluconolactonase
VLDDLHTLDISDPERWAERCADVLAAAIEAAITRSDRCLLGLSGGSTPAPVFDLLACRELPWDKVCLVQVDERLAPAGDTARNLTGQQAAFGHLPVEWMPLPVDDILDIEAESAADEAARTAAVLDRFTTDLVGLAGEPPILDVVHLGLGDDGHTASLLPEDPLLNELRTYVGITGEYRGHRRLSLTRPMLDRARLVLWLVKGASKVGPLGKLLAGDLGIPAGLVRPAASVVLADAEAARQA